MVDFNKYNEKEVFAAIKVVEEILDVEDFDIDIVYDAVLSGNAFCLIDRQGAYLGDIDSDRFSNLGSVIDRTDTYHHDSFYDDYKKRVKAREEIPQNDWDRKILIFFESKYCQELLMAIDVETYLAYKDKQLNDIKLNHGESEKYVNEDGRFDDVGYLCDKSIAVAIMNTQSGYPMVEYNNSIYVAAHCDWYDNTQQMFDDLRAGENSYCNNYSSYGILVETELYQVKDDMHDIGLYNEKDDWSFYLSEYELEYIGLGEELEELQNQYDTEDMLIGLDEGNESVVDELIADSVKRSKATENKGEFSVEIEK